MSFATLKKSRTDNFDKLMKESQKLKSENYNNDDDRFWKPTVDKAGNGRAKFRFLPAPQGEDVPWVRYQSYSFEGPGGWYIENSLESINKKDPVAEYNSRVEKDDRKWWGVNYVTNILMIDDPANEENNGKVFLFKFGTQTWNILADVMNPERTDENGNNLPPFNPFDFWEGADFTLRARKVNKFRNYEKSSFGPQTQLKDGDDEELEKVYNSLYSLQAFLDPKNFKEYAALESKLEKVLGEKSSLSKAEDYKPYEAAPTAEKPESAKADAPKQETKEASESDEDLSFFEQLADTPDEE